MLELVEEALDEVAFPVERLVGGVWPAAVTARRDDGLGPGLQDGVVEVVGVIGAVGDDGVGRQAIDQVVGAGDVVLLPRSRQQPCRIAEGVGCGVQLGAQAAAGAAQALGMRPPFSRRAPAAC